MKDSQVPCQIEGTLPPYRFLKMPVRYKGSPRFTIHSLTVFCVSFSQDQKPGGVCFKLIGLGKGPMIVNLESVY